SDPQFKQQLESHWDGAWGDRRQELVFIGSAMDEKYIRASLDSCLAYSANVQPRVARLLRAFLRKWFRSAELPPPPRSVSSVATSEWCQRSQYARVVQQALSVETDLSVLFHLLHRCPLRAPIW